MSGAPLRFCFVLSSAYPGVSSAYFEYTQSLAKAGHSVHVVAAHLATEGDRVICRHEGSVQVTSLPIKTFRKAGLSATFFAWRARRVVSTLDRENAFDVVQVKSFPNLGLMVGPLLRRSTGSNFLDIRSPAIGNSFVNQLSTRIVRWQRTRFDHTFVISAPLRARLFNDGRDDVTLLPLGVNFDRFRRLTSRASLRKKAGYGPDDIVFVYTGSLHPRRTPGVMLVAFEQVTKAHPVARLLLVGDGAAVADLRRDAVRMGIADRVRLTGPVPYERMNEWLSLSDVGLAYIPVNSTFDAQPPLKTLEFLACALPVVATRTAGNALFVNEQLGKMVDDDAGDLANAMLQLCRDKVFRESASLAARGAIAAHSYDQIVDNDLIGTIRALRSESPTNAGDGESGTDERLT